MEYIINSDKYGDRTLSDEQIEHDVNLFDASRYSMQECLREKQFNEADKKAIEDHFEKRFF